MGHLFGPGEIGGVEVLLQHLKRWAWCTVMAPHRSETGKPDISPVCRIADEWVMVEAEPVFGPDQRPYPPLEKCLAHAVVPFWIAFLRDGILKFREQLRGQVLKTDGALAEVVNREEEGDDPYRLVLGKWKETAEPFAEPPILPQERPSYGGHVETVIDKEVVRRPTLGSICARLAPVTIVAFAGRWGRAVHPGRRAS